MEVCLYAGIEKLIKVCRNIKIRFFRKQSCENFFSSPDVLKPYGVLSQYNVLNAPPIFLFSIEVSSMF